MTVSPSPASSATETHRPNMHFTAADTWINDPNGLVYADGVYHLFYQNNPYGTGHANMSWGHATSPDLHHWLDRRVAILCDGNEEIFSGSAVVDETNSAGFGGPGSAPLVAIYTSNYSDASPYPGIQAQSLAYSLDGGDSWTKYAGNPVLNRDSPDFRDPKVFRYQGPAGEYWVMVAVEAVDRKVVLYRSDDLRNWAYLSEYTSSSPVGIMWECPDLFPLAVDGDPGNTKWVLIISLGGELDDRGTASIFFIGDFDGVTFTASGGRSSAHTSQPEWEWLDFGRDYYAAVSFNNAPDNRRLLIGWMSNWNYARDLPTAPWRGALALPREASLHAQDGRIVLRQRPVEGLVATGLPYAESATVIREGTWPLSQLTENAYMINAVLEPGDAQEFGLIVRAGEGRGTRIGYDVIRGELVVDRMKSGHTSFHPRFASRETALVELLDGRLHLSIYLDASSVEVFAQDGLATVTDLIFPHASDNGFSVYARGGTATIVEMRILQLQENPISRPGAVQLVQGLLGAGGK